MNPVVIPEKMNAVNMMHRVMDQWERVCTSLQMPADAEGSNPDRPCKNLHIVADTRPAAIGQSSTHVSLLREIAAAA